MEKFMSINRNYSAMDNESLIANYILQSGKFGLCTRSDLTKGLRTELKSRIIPNYDSLTINKIEEGINKKLHRYNELNRSIILSNLKDMLNFLPEDTKEGGNLLDIIAPNQNEL
jgi:hypothetical protein